MKFPVANYREVSRVASKLNFYLCRRTRGSHEIWRRDLDGRQTTIPNHGSKSIKRRTLKSIFDDLQISIEEFIKLK